MTALYRDHEISITCEPTEAYFIVRYPNGAKMTSGFFGLDESLRAKYQELRTRIDTEIAETA